MRFFLCCAPTSPFFSSPLFTPLFFAVSFQLRGTAASLTLDEVGIPQPISFTRSTRHYQTGCCRCCSCNIVARPSLTLSACLALPPALIESWLDALEIDLRDSIYGTFTGDCRVHLHSDSKLFCSLGNVSPMIDSEYNFCFCQLNNEYVGSYFFQLHWTTSVTRIENEAKTFACERKRLLAESV